MIIKMARNYCITSHPDGIPCADGMYHQIRMF